MQKIQMKRVQAYTCGQGDPLLLISGLSGLGAIWNALMQNMPTHRTITFDHPGIGASPPAPEQTIDGIVQASLEVMDELEIEAAHILGHSTGTLVAQSLALDYPQRVSRLVLSSGWAAPDRRFRDLFTLRKTVLGTLGPTSYQTLGNVLGYPSQHYDLLNTPTQPFNAQQIEVITERIDMLLEYNRAEDLRSITQPTLVLGAYDDAIVPFHHADELAEAIPQAVLRELSGGHFTQYVRPEEYACILAEFLTS